MVWPRLAKGNAVLYSPMGEKRTPFRCHAVPFSVHHCSLLLLSCGWTAWRQAGPGPRTTCWVWVSQRHTVSQCNSGNTVTVSGVPSLPPPLQALTLGPGSQAGAGPGRGGREGAGGRLRERGQGLTLRASTAPRTSGDATVHCGNSAVTVNWGRARAWWGRCAGGGTLRGSARAHPFVPLWGGEKGWGSSTSLGGCNAVMQCDLRVTTTAHKEEKGKERYESG